MISPKFKYGFPPYDDYCIQCGVQQDEITNIRQYPLNVRGEYLCEICWDKTRTAFEDIADMLAQDEEEMNRLKQRSKRQLYDALHTYKDINEYADFIDFYDYEELTKSSLIDLIVDHDIEDEFCDFLDINSKYHII